jgi:hypothetical protein
MHARRKDGIFLSNKQIPSKEDKEKGSKIYLMFSHKNLKLVR